MTDTFENVIYEETLKYNLIKAFKDVASILKHHSGPFATNALIGSKWRQVNDVDEFTKDGINIFSHILVDEDSAARLAIRLARFVGIAVDNRCHDGTTTSMLTLCGLAQVALEKLDLDLFDRERYNWIEDLTQALRYCLDYLNELKITVADIAERCASFGIDTTQTEIRRAMAYHMAMISSKGDKDLSDKIATVVGASPGKIYGMFRNIPSALETEEAYILKKQEYDLGVRANLGNMADFNHLNGTQYLSENAVIFATANDLSVKSMEAGFLEAFISDKPRIRADLATFGLDKGWEHFHEGKRNLIIMSPMMGDPGLIETINEFNYKNPDVKISWFMLQVDHKMRISFNKTLHYMASTPLFDDVMTSDASRSLIGLHNGSVAKVHLIGSNLTISNLYTRDGGTYHPLYNDPETFPAYNEFCRETQEIIAHAQDNVTNPSLDQRQLTELTSLYRSLTLQDIHDIEVGGSRHDQYANRTVYEDAIGAALSAVDEGVVLGGYAHLAIEMAYKEGEVFERFQQIFENLLLDSLRIEDATEGLELIHRYPDQDKWSYIVADRACYRNRVTASDYVKHVSLGRQELIDFLAMDTKHPVLLQSYGGYHEQFRRFGTILPKLANTTLLVDMRTQQDAGGA